MSFAQRVFLGFPSSFGMRCRSCDAVLCLEGKNKTFAECLSILVWLIATFLGVAFAGGAIELLSNDKGVDIGLFIAYAFIVITILLLIVFGIPFIINWIIIVPFCKNLGYISISKDAKYIVERRRWPVKRWPVVFFLSMLLFLSPLTVILVIYGAPKFTFYIWFIAALITMMVSIKKYKKISSNMRYLICFFVVFFCSLVIFFQWGGMFWVALIPVLFIVSWWAAVILFVRRNEIENPETTSNGN